MTTPEPNNGGPAFPTDNEAQVGYNRWHYEGMSLRDYFAAKVMQGLVSTLTHPTKGHMVEAAELVEMSVQELIARGAYAYADAMLEARKGGDQ